MPTDLSVHPRSNSAQFIPKIQYLTEKEVSVLTGRARQTLANDRHHRRGFPYVKFGGSVRYNLADILEAMNSHRIDPGAM
jgi:hypothetical protein